LIRKKTLLKKTVTYEDFNGEKQTEDFYFNLSKAELLEMELTAPGESMADHLKAIVAAGNNQVIMDTFKSIIFRAYGEKSVDGKHFHKSDEKAMNFANSAAYHELFVELVTDAKAAAEFVNGVVPPEVAQSAASSAEDKRIEALANMQGHKPKQEKPKATTEVVPDLPAAEPVLEAYNEHVSEPDLGAMTKEELLAHFADKK
jgi:hypothetical protein